MSSIIITFLEESSSEPTPNFAASFSSSSSFVSLMKAKIPMSADFNSTSHLISLLQINDPNIIGEVNFTQHSKMIVVMNNVVGSYRFKSRSKFTTILNKRLSFGNSLNFLVDVIPESVINTYQQYTCRFKINNTELPIKKFSVKYPKNSIGVSVELTMARNSDYSSLVQNNSTRYNFDIGIVSGGSTQWFPIINQGILENKNITVGWNGLGPTDTLTISTLSSIDERLSYSPDENIIMYDTLRVEIDSSEVKPLFDTDGNIFHTALRPFNPLTLYNVLNVGLSTVGFFEWKTNIPNFQIKRLDIFLTDSVMSAISAVLGPFKPIFTFIDGVLWILDTTTIFPSGFPSPGTVKADNYEVLNRSSNHTKIDALLVSYIQNDFEGRFFIEDIESEANESGTFGTDSYSRTETSTRIRKYFNPEEPHIYTRELIKSSITSVYGNGELLISRNTESFIYDSYGRLSKSDKNYESLVPDVTSEGDLIFLTVRNEQETITYGAHPFHPNRQIQLKRVVTASGLLSIDEDNTYFGEPARQDYLRAHESLNLNSNMTSVFAPLWTLTERTKPVNNGQVKVYVQKIDHVRNVVLNTTSAERTGDISLSALRSTSKQILVFPKNYQDSKKRRYQSFNIGELPLSIGIPLARRVIEKLNTKNSNVSFTWIGFNPYLQRGLIQEVLGRNNVSLGKYIIEDITVDGDNLGTKNQRITTNFSGDEV